MFAFLYVKATSKEICEELSFPSFSEKCWRQHFCLRFRGNCLGKMPHYHQFSLWIPIALARIFFFHLVLIWARKTFKDDFQSVLLTLKSLFMSFVLIHVRHHKIVTFCNYLLTWSTCKFKVSCQPSLWMQSLMLRSLWDHLMKQLLSCKIKETVGKRILNASKIHVRYMYCKQFITNYIDLESIKWDSQTLGCRDWGIPNWKSSKVNNFVS